MTVNKLLKGDKVVMHDCMEARGRENIVWECTCDSFEICGSEVVFLKGYSGCFDTDFLKKVEEIK
jgi:hypothetical protein